MKLISIVMPVYGVEKYLEQCIQSVINQTYKNIEIIIINDGSPDRSGEIIDHFANRDKRIVAIHKENGGYGSAINAGISIAKGEYIAIVETDDWIEPDMIANLLDAASLDPTCDIIKAGFNRIKEERVVSTQSLKHICSFRNGIGYISPSDSLDMMLLESSIWTALYKRSFLEKHNLLMLESKGASYQDCVFKFMCYTLTDRIILMDLPVYNYRLFALGSSSSSSDKALAMFNNYFVIEKFLRERKLFEKNKESFFIHQCFDFVFHINRLSGDAEKLFIEEARKVIDRMREEGVSIDDIKLSPDVNDYLHSSVLPVLEYISTGAIAKHSKSISFLYRIKAFLKRKLLNG